MNATNKLLDKWIAWRSLKPGADLRVSAIALELDVKPTAIANYRAGVSQAAPHVISKLAADLGENELAWLALVESERARNGSDRRTWARMARQLGAAAAIAVVALLPFNPAIAKVNGGTPYALCEVVRALTRRMADWLAARSRYASPAVLA